MPNPIYNQANTMYVVERSPTQKAYFFFCPGCKSHHHFDVGDAPGHLVNNDFESPSFEPSLHYKGKCHLNLRNGYLEFLNDCAHELANKVVPLPQLPH